MPEKNKSNEIRITRVYDAPVEAVWDAWTDPEQVGQWWGPRGFTITTHSKDLRVGGHWSYTMHGPDGINYENKTIYFVVDKHKKLVYDHGGNDDRPPLFRVTVLFSESAGKTTMEMSMALATSEAATEMRKFIRNAGGNATWDRLAEYLEKESTGRDQFVINRTFDAPIDLMFEMWTHPKHLSQWLAPTGFTMEFIQSNIKLGGKTLFFMTDNKSVKFFARAEYQKIEKPNKLVYTQQFCDEQGNVSRHPGAPVWPQTMLTTVELTAETASSTRVTVTWEPFGATTREELAAFIEARGGMTMGWTGSFDKLEALVQKG